jgi:hypothetical protein
MFVKSKGAFQFERPHDGEACAVGKTEILVGVSFKNSKSRVLNRRGNCDNFNSLGSGNGNTVFSFPPLDRIFFHANTELPNPGTMASILERRRHRTPSNS